MASFSQFILMQYGLAKDFLGVPYHATARINPNGITGAS